MPVRGRHGESRNDRTQCRTCCCERCPPGQEVWQLEQGVDVADGGATSCQTRAAEEALKESQDDEGGEAVHHRGGDGDYDENAEGDHVRRVAADQGNLRER